VIDVRWEQSTASQASVRSAFHDVDLDRVGLQEEVPRTSGHDSVDGWIYLQSRMRLDDRGIDSNVRKVGEWDPAT
jgi:hypothetical protein